MANHAKELAIKFFKRNPKALAAHVVLDKVTDSQQKAKLYRNSVFSKTITTFTRQELADELGENNKSESVPNEN